MIVFYFIILVILDAVGDATLNKGAKHIIQAVNVLAWLFLGTFIFYTKQWNFLVFPDVLVMIAAYIGIRFFLFDWIWNGVRKMPIAYFGSTSVYDIFMKQFNPVFVIFIKFVVGIGSMILIINFQ